MSFRWSLHCSGSHAFERSPRQAVTARILIRAFTPSDTQRIVDLFRDTVRNVNIADYTMEQVCAWAPDEIDADAWRERLLSNLAYVAELDGEIAGFCELKKDGVVHTVYTHKDLQGIGIGGMLLEHLERRALQEGLKQLSTEASVTARPFFERYGYRTLKVQTKHYRDTDFTNFIMTKTLAGRMEHVQES
jgi:putative acetyltransferase